MRVVLLSLFLNSFVISNNDKLNIHCYYRFFELNVEFPNSTRNQNLVINDSIKLFSYLIDGYLSIYNIDNHELIHFNMDTLLDCRRHVIQSKEDYILQGKYGFIVRRKGKESVYISKSSLPNGVGISNRYDYNYDFERGIFIVRVYNYNRINPNGSAFDGVALWDGNDFYKELDLNWDEYFQNKRSLFDDDLFFVINDNKYFISSSHSNRYFIVSPDDSFHVESNQLDIDYDVSHFETTDVSDPNAKFAIRRSNYDFKHKFGPLVPITLDSTLFLTRLYFYNVNMESYIASKSTVQEFEIQFYKNNRLVKCIYEPGGVYFDRKKLNVHKNVLSFTEKQKFLNSNSDKSSYFVRNYNFILSK